MLSDTQFQTAPVARNASPSNLNQNVSIHEPRHQFTCRNCSGETRKKENSPVSGPGHTRNASLLALPRRPPLCPTDLGPASSSLPLFSKSTAKLFMDVSVSGCWAPSWDSRPSKARRQRLSAWRLEMEREGRETRGTPSSSPDAGLQKGKKSQHKPIKATIFGLAVRKSYSKRSSSTL